MFACSNSIYSPSAMVSQISDSNFGHDPSVSRVIHGFSIMALEIPVKVPSKRHEPLARRAKERRGVPRSALAL